MSIFFLKGHIDLRHKLRRVDADKLDNAPDVVGPHGVALAGEVIGQRWRLNADVFGHPCLLSAWL